MFYLMSVIVQTYKVYTKYETKNILLRTVLKILSTLTTCLIQKVERFQTRSLKIIIRLPSHSLIPRITPG